jgi:hypothetical protein
MATITVKVSGKRLADTAITNAKLMREVGLLARERILKRTQAGRDEDGAPFKAYSKAYAEQKTKGLGSAAPVNLQVSGRMLQGLTLTDVTENSVTIGFKD